MSKIKAPSIKENPVEVVDDVTLNAKVEEQENQEQIKDNEKEVVRTEEPTSSGIENEPAFSRNELNPSNWNIFASSDSDLIEFTNSVTGRVFKGTIDQFNNMLRISNSVES